MPVDDEQLPLLGRTAQGYQAVRLRKTETIAGLGIVEASDELVLVTERGYCKRLPVEELRLGERGAIGTQGLRFANRSDRLMAIVRAVPGAELVLQLNGDRLLRLPIASLKTQGKDGTGQRPKLLKSKDSVISTRLCLPTGGE
jgi:DNA gyrase subunit A